MMIAPRMMETRGRDAVAAAVFGVEEYVVSSPIFALLPVERITQLK